MILANVHPEFLVWVCHRALGLDPQICYILNKYSVTELDSSPD